MRNRGNGHGHPSTHPHETRHRRRRGRKRRAAAHGLLMGAMIFGAQAKPKASTRTGQTQELMPVAEVTVRIDQFAALPAYLAYEDVIEAAALAHEVNPDLIHAVIETESAFNAM